MDVQGYYRKHTARDSSSLFRVVSEAVYATQQHHKRVREECVDYMYSQRRLFEPFIQHQGHDFDIYLADLSKMKTRGSLLELQATAMLYRRNVLLFEPMTTGFPLLHDESFDTTLKVFYTNESRHFDSVYAKDEIEKLALCQSVVYELLYENVFKLPDVKYAVEKMLYDPCDTEMPIQSSHEGDYVIALNGRKLVMSTAKDTSCVLGSEWFCNFHNKHGDRHKSRCDYLAGDKKMSCVRQLMKAGITPFPYKIAKALDQSIYRNVEFDTWAAIRREYYYKSLINGRTNDLKVSEIFPFFFQLKLVWNFDTR